MATLGFCESFYFPNDDFVCEHDDFPFCDCLAKHASTATQPPFKPDLLNTTKPDLLTTTTSTTTVTSTRPSVINDVPISENSIGIYPDSQFVSRTQLEVGYSSSPTTLFSCLRDTILEDLDEDSEEDEHHEEVEGAVAPLPQYSSSSPRQSLSSLAPYGPSASPGAFCPEGRRRASIVTSDSRKGSLVPQPVPIRIAVFGKDGVGKSALIVRLVTGRFIGEYDPTMEAVYHYQVPLQGMEMPLQVMDTAGAVETTEEGREAQISWGEGFILVFSLTSHSSLQALHHIRRVLVDLTPGSPRPFVLVGNKADLSHAREVTPKEILELADHWGCEYFEVSAAEPWEIVVRPFTAIYQAVLDKRRE